VLFELKKRWFFSICINSPLKHFLCPLMDFENVRKFLVGIIRRFHQGGK